RFPHLLSRWAAELARQILRLRGVTVPPLDEMIRRVDVDQRELVAELVLPADSGMVDRLISASGHPLDEPLVSDIYCRIAAAQRKAPAGTLAQLVRRTFDPALAEDDEDFTRAALVALSLLVVGEQAHPLAPQAVELAKNCPHPAGGYLLQQREDLAKHWTFSAGLTAVLGGETARSLGEWKELDDSLPKGSGFSFVDLSADRSGLQTALRALDPETAAKTTAELARVTDQDLLPSTLLRGPEGLSEGSFIDDYGSLDRARYLSAVQAIDRVLARQRSAKSGTT
ncbi:MAG TPA: hypothetical protein VFS49_03435, partial [Croceibacterium sp.]|nr:hypothetical protein [Croceibacterium sp.]